MSGLHKTHRGDAAWCTLEAAIGRAKVLEQYRRVHGRKGGHASLFFGPVPPVAVCVRFRYSDKWGNMDMCDFSNAFGMDTIVKVRIVPLIQVQQLARFARELSLGLRQYIFTGGMQANSLLHRGIVSGVSNIVSSYYTAVVADVWKNIFCGPW